MGTWTDGIRCGERETCTDRTHAASDEHSANTQCCGPNRKAIPICGEESGQVSLLTRSSQSHMADTDSKRSGESGDTGKARQGPWPVWGSGSSWNDYTWIRCADNKFRRSPHNLVGLAHGLPDGVYQALGEEEAPFHRSILAALGNSIVWPVAMEIMKAIKQAHRVQ